MSVWRCFPPEERISVNGALMKIYEGPALASVKSRDITLLSIYIEGAHTAYWRACAAVFSADIYAHPADPCCRKAGYHRRRQRLRLPLASWLATVDDWITELAYVPRGWLINRW